MESIKILTGVLMVCSLTGADHCVSPQYLEKSTTGTIQCSFSSDFISVHWYDTAENLQDIDPILSYEDSSKRGEGFVSGEFDIHPNGSLIINDVNIKHETKFTVTVVVSTTKIPESFVIEVKVTVSPTYPFPLVNATLLTDEIVQFVELGRESSLFCNVEGSRPFIPLSWSIRTNDGDMNIPFSNYSINNSGRYSSFSTLKYRFSKNVYIALLVCKADDSLMLLDRYETFILAQNKDIDLERFNASSAVYSINTRMQLKCSGSKFDAVIWKKITQREIMDNVAFAVSRRPNYTKLLSDDVMLSSDGSLIIPDVSIQHEGQYVCIHQDQNTNGIEVHNLTVIVNPSPSYPVFDGCNHDQYCVLEVEREGTLLCSLSGIRPSVTLIMRSYHEDEIISFSRQNMETIGHDNVFDVHLRVWFSMHPTAKSGRITVECSATGENSGYFTSLSTQIDLQFFAGGITDAIVDEDKRTLNIWYFIAPSIGILIVVSLVSVIITVLKCRARAGRKSERHKKFMDEEVGLLMTETKQEKLDEFVQQISTTYKEICSSIQPIPYEMDKRYSVKDIFVDVGLKNVHSNSLERENNSTHLIKYKDFIDVFQEKGSRIIIEGEPGYGKTIYTLRIIYDWLKTKETSLVGKFQLLLYISLREVSFKTSLFQAIKQLLLPKDSLITVPDIADIMSKTTSTLIILDGYDELIERDEESDINDIIARKCLQNSNVILTTRSSILPRRYSTNTKRLKMTGFDQVAQKDYLRKFLKSETLALQTDTDSFMSNPIINDICKVPLVFAVFVKISQEIEDAQKFGAVSFFRQAILSYHYHLCNKDRVSEETILEHLPSKWSNKDINKLAFDSFRKDENYRFWSRKVLNDKLGQECANIFIAVGIFVLEEKTVFNVDISGSATIQKEQNVRFSHNIFSEWYAAHHVVENILSANAKQRSSEFDILYDLDPFNQEYIFRFICGLDDIAADITIKHLMDIGNDETLAVLCSLEKPKKKSVNTILTKVNHLCKKVIQFDSFHTKLTQRATMQLLAIASKNQISITEVSIYECLNSIDRANGVIYLTDELPLPVLNTLHKLTISDRRKNFTNDEIEGILQFCLKCRKLDCLSFENCFLPEERLSWITISGRAKDLRVLWCPSGTWYRLDTKLGRWKSHDLEQPMTFAAYQNEANSRHIVLD